MVFHRNSLPMKVMSWLADMLHIQVLWIAYTIAGLVVGGFFPATFAMFAVMREMIHKSPDFSFHKKFKSEYRANFIKSNKLGYTLVIVAIALVFYFRMTINLDGSWAVLFVFLGYGAIILALLSLLYVPVVFAHFDLSISQILRHALIIMFASPVQSLANVVIVILFGVLTQELPALTPFISFAMFSYGITYFAYRAFNRLSERQKV